MQCPQPIQPKIAVSLLHATPFSIFKLKSPQMSTHNPQPLQSASFIVISAASFTLEVGIAILLNF
jgi:hypothetical protein